MDLSQVTKLQQDARSMARAALYMGRAANELAPIALPAAKDAVARVPGSLRDMACRLRALAPENLGKRRSALLIAAGVGAVGFSVAAIAHVAHHRKVVSAYRKHRRLEASEHQQLADVERLLGQASAQCSAAEFLAGQDGAGKDASPETLGGPGCFAICVYDLEPAEGDYRSYRDVYVGASKSMGASVKDQLEGKGNLYVHADTVYRRPVRVFFFPCEGYEVYALKEGLVRTLGAERSYNRVTEIADLD